MCFTDLQKDLHSLQVLNSVTSLLLLCSIFIIHDKFLLLKFYTVFTELICFMTLHILSAQGNLTVASRTITVIF